MRLILIIFFMVVFSVIAFCEIDARETNTIVTVANGFVDVSGIGLNGKLTNRKTVNPGYEVTVGADGYVSHAKKAILLPELLDLAKEDNFGHSQQRTANSNYREKAYRLINQFADQLSRQDLRVIDLLSDDFIYTVTNGDSYNKNQFYVALTQWFRMSKRQIFVAIPRGKSGENGWLIDLRSTVYIGQNQWMYLRQKILVVIKDNKICSIRGFDFPPLPGQTSGDVFILAGDKFNGVAVPATFAVNSETGPRAQAVLVNRTTTLTAGGNAIDFDTQSLVSSGGDLNYDVFGNYNSLGAATVTIVPTGVPYNSLCSSSGFNLVSGGSGPAVGDVNVLRTNEGRFVKFQITQVSVSSMTIQYTVNPLAGNTALCN